MFSLFNLLVNKNFSASKAEVKENILQFKSLIKSSINLILAISSSIMMIVLPDIFWLRIFSNEISGLSRGSSIINKAPLLWFFTVIEPWNWLIIDLTVTKPIPIPSFLVV